MSNRLFQGVIHQMKDVLNRAVGVIDENGIVFSATVPVKPAVEIEGYKGIEAAKEVAPVTDVEVENEIKIVRERNSRETEITDETPAALGDSTKIDFEGFVDGVAFEGGKGEDYNLKLGSGSFIPGFEEGLVGVIPANAVDSYEAVIMSRKEAEMLGCKTGSCGFFVQRRTYTEGGMVYEFTQSLMRADRVKLDVFLHKDGVSFTRSVDKN